MNAGSDSTELACRIRQTAICRNNVIMTGWYNLSFLDESIARVVVSIKNRNQMASFEDRVLINGDWSDFIGTPCNTPNGPYLRQLACQIQQENMCRTQLKNLRWNLLNLNDKYTCIALIKIDGKGQLDRFQEDALIKLNWPKILFIHPITPYNNQQPGTTPPLMGQPLFPPIAHTQQPAQNAINYQGTVYYNGSAPTSSQGYGSYDGRSSDNSYLSHYQNGNGVATMPMNQLPPQGYQPQGYQNGTLGYVNNQHHMNGARTDNPQQAPLASKAVDVPPVQKSSKETFKEQAQAPVSNPVNLENQANGNQNVSNNNIPPTIETTTAPVIVKPAVNVSEPKENVVLETKKIAVGQFVQSISGANDTSTPIDTPKNTQPNAPVATGKKAQGSQKPVVSPSNLIQSMKQPVNKVAAPSPTPGKTTNESAKEDTQTLRKSPVTEKQVHNNSGSQPTQVDEQSVTGKTDKQIPSAPPPEQFEKTEHDNGYGDSNDDKKKKKNDVPTPPVETYASKATRKPTETMDFTKLPSNPKSVKASVSSPENNKKSSNTSLDNNKPPKKFAQKTVVGESSYPVSSGKSYKYNSKPKAKEYDKDGFEIVYNNAPIPTKLYVSANVKVNKMEEETVVKKKEQPTVAVFKPTDFPELSNLSSSLPSAGKKSSPNKIRDIKENAKDKETKKENHLEILQNGAPTGENTKKEEKAAKGEEKNEETVLPLSSSHESTNSAMPSSASSSRKHNSPKKKNRRTPTVFDTEDDETLLNRLIAENAEKKKKQQVNVVEEPLKQSDGNKGEEKPEEEPKQREEVIKVEVKRAKNKVPSPQEVESLVDYRLEELDIIRTEIRTGGKSIPKKFLPRIEEAAKLFAKQIMEGGKDISIFIKMKDVNKAHIKRKDEQLVRKLKQRMADHLKVQKWQNALLAEFYKKIIENYCSEMRPTLNWLLSIDTHLRLLQEELKLVESYFPVCEENFEFRELIGFKHVHPNLDTTEESLPEQLQKVHEETMERISSVSMESEVVGKPPFPRKLNDFERLEHGYIAKPIEIVPPSVEVKKDVSNKIIVNGESTVQTKKKKGKKEKKKGEKEETEDEMLDRLIKENGTHVKQQRIEDNFVNSLRISSGNSKNIRRMKYSNQQKDNAFECGVSTQPKTMLNPSEQQSLYKIQMENFPYGEVVVETCRRTTLMFVEDIESVIENGMHPDNVKNKSYCMFKDFVILPNPEESMRDSSTQLLKVLDFLQRRIEIYMIDDEKYQKIRCFVYMFLHEIASTKRIAVIPTLGALADVEISGGGFEERETDFLKMLLSEYDQNKVAKDKDV